MKILGSMRMSAIVAMVITVSLLTNNAAGVNSAHGIVSGVTTKEASAAIPVASGSNTVDPFRGKQWALQKIHLLALQDLAVKNPGPLVAILDTGIDRTHPDLAGRVMAKVNFTNSPTVTDINGHGTHVAGIIAANTNNGIGIAGAAPQSRLLNVKVVEDDGTCRASVVARGIIWAADRGAKVINISLEIGPSTELENAVNYAWNKGAIIIAAAGNSGSSKPVYPAYFTNCIAVAGTMQDDELAPLSNYGDRIDCAAPGYQIFSTLPDGKYGYENGTSSAAAYVSGIAALLMTSASDTNGNGRINDEVRGIIANSCQKMNVDGTGNGRLDAAIYAANTGN